MEPHHIGLQTDDVEATVRWYLEFLPGSEVNWSLDSFSDLTRERLPGISRLVEIQLDRLRLHVYDREGLAGEQPPAPTFQHVGLTVSSPEELDDLRERWYELNRGGEYPQSRGQEPSPVVFDGDGVGSLYVEDINGLELEFVYIPADSNR